MDSERVLHMRYILDICNDGVFMSGISDIFSGGLFKSIEGIATEWIDTDMESAEAKALKLKVLDPNGKMRRDLTRFICYMYGTYLIVMLMLLTFEFFGFVPQGQTPEVIANVTTKLTNTFTPVSTAFGLIVSASFGVNFYNVKKGK